MTTERASGPMAFNYQVRASTLCSVSIVASLLLVSVSCSPPQESDGAGRPTLEQMESAQQAWNVERIDELTAEDGWAAVVGLFWLSEGEQSIGWGETVDIQLPESPTAAPARLATVRLFFGDSEGGERLEASVVPEVDAYVSASGKQISAKGDFVSLLSEPGEDPPTIHYGEFEIFAIKRGEQYALRVRNRASPARERLVEIPTYPVAPQWVIDGRFESADSVRELAIDNSTDYDYPQRSVGRFVFDRDGDSFAMDLVGADAAEPLLLMVADETSGDTTYGGGRYVYVEVKGDGAIRADFNRLYNPPCVFTAYATCPLPPRSNHLPYSIEAGEKYPIFNRPAEETASAESVD